MSPVSDIAFSPAVKAMQARQGSRMAYARMSEKGDWPSEITQDLASFIGEQTSFFLATASTDGQPYMQHRGGPPGFLHVLDARTLAFADFVGNRQYITVGNLSENPKSQLFLIDYTHRQRVKLWGKARVSEDEQLLRELMPSGYRAQGERCILFTVTAWNANCPKHIPQRVEAADVETALRDSRQRIAELEAKLARLHQEKHED